MLRKPTIITTISAYLWPNLTIASALRRVAKGGRHGARTPHRNTLCLGAADLDRDLRDVPLPVGLPGRYRKDRRRLRGPLGPRRGARQHAPGSDRPGATVSRTASHT